MKEEQASGSSDVEVPPDTGLIALVMLARFHGLAADPAQLQHEFAVEGAPFGSDEILHGARKLGLKAKRVKTRLERLPMTPLPAV